MFHVKQLLRRLTPEQQNNLKAFEAAVQRLNTQINLVSRPSAKDFQTRHLTDCLALAGRNFPDGATVVDWGTGGGLPAVPLSIVFPKVTVYAVDANRRKYFALRQIQRQLDLSNLHPWHGRAEAFPYALQYSVSRATASLVHLWAWHIRRAKPAAQTRPGYWRDGLVCLKGGDLRIECNELTQRYAGLRIEIVPLTHASRCIVHVYQDASI